MAEVMRQTIPVLVIAKALGFLVLRAVPAAGGGTCRSGTCSRSRPVPRSARPSSRRASCGFGDRPMCRGRSTCWMGEHAHDGPWRPVSHPHGKGSAREERADDGAARPDRRGGRGRADDREGDRRERLPGDGAGGVHRRRPGEDRHADPRGESAGGPRADRRPSARNTTSTRSSSRSRPLRRRRCAISWSIAARSPLRSGFCPASAT